MGARLRALRAERGLSQEKASELIGIHAKHLQRLERGTANVTIATLIAVTQAYGVVLGSLFSERSSPSKQGRAAARRPRTASAPPLRRVDAARVRPYRNSIPLYSLQAAAGKLGDRPAAEPAAEPEAWVVPRGRTRPGPGLFVAQVIGDSMNRRIPSGSYCVFRHPVVGGRDGRVVLVQHRDIQDPDHGGHFTVKVWKSRKVKAGPDSWSHSQIRLLPDTDAPGYQPIVLRQAGEGEVTVIAELVEVLGARIG